jgi:rhodanese-related sulfurtransferase
MFFEEFIMVSKFKKLNGLFAVILFAMFVFITSCSDDTTSPTNNTESATLIQYLEGTGGDFINVTGNAIVAATDVKSSITADPTKYFVMDIRDTATFAKGHITGAVNVQFKDILTYFKTNDMTKYTKVYMVCYSGQSAAYAAGLLRMDGYSNVFSMKFGMASWHSDFMGTWKTKIGNAGASAISKDSVAKPAAGNLPIITTGKTDGKEILDARVAQAFADGFPSIGQDVVLANVNNYFVAAYWSVADYMSVGHIAGAPCYTAKTDLKSTTNLKTLPTDKTIAIYCYTGHTAAYAAAFLKVMGYDVKSISFGGNAMFYDLMLAANKSAWKDTECQNYDIVK